MQIEAISHKIDFHPHLSPLPSRERTSEIPGNTIPIRLATNQAARSSRISYTLTHGEAKLKEAGSA
jgi:hypothetical protein